MVSIDIPVLNALEDMGIDVTKDIPTFTRWAAEAEKEIGSYFSYKRKRAVLTISNCSAKLPCDAAFVQGALLGDHGTDCAELFKQSFDVAVSLAAEQSDTFLVVSVPDPNSTIALSGLKWQAQQGNFVLSHNYDKQKVTIQYLGFSLDDRGLPLICEGHAEAIVEFIMYKFCVRSRFSPIKMDHSDIQRHYKEWNRLCSHARADDAEISESDRNEIISMIHDPWIGYGMTNLTNRSDY